MRDQPTRKALPASYRPMNAQNAVAGLRGRDVLSTLRSLALQGVKQPIHSARHALALGGQLGRVLLGDQQDRVAATLTGAPHELCVAGINLRQDFNAEPRPI